MTEGNDRILIIDDDPDIQAAYRLVLAPERVENSSADRLARLLGKNPAAEEKEVLRFQLGFASQGPDGVEMAATAFHKNQPYAVAFVDIRMPPGFDGMETAARIRRLDPNIEIVIVTAYSDRSREEIVQAVGTPERLLFLRKPFDPEELTQLALSLTAKWNLARQSEDTKAALIKSEARFRALVETTSDWVWETDSVGYFTYCSPLCETMYGYRPDELLGRSLFDSLVSAEDTTKCRALFTQCVQSRQGFQNIERCCKTKEGRSIYIESSGTPFFDDDGLITGFRGIDRDITKRKIIEKEREELEIQYRQSQKLEALGTLAGGIAHDLNNVLTPIMGGTQLSLMQLDQTHPVYNHIRTIEKGAQKAAELIHQILAFSRKQVLSAKPLNLTVLIKDFSAMLRRLISENIHLTFSLEEQLGTIDADRNQMEQILINLVVNARDAVDSGGEIVIETANRLVTEQDPSQIRGEIPSGSYVVMSVADNGVGIDSTLVNHIFDPFFTTKEPGKGTGLGLSTVYGIVKQHEGEAIVESTPGQGTRFDIYFPRIENHIPTEEPSPAKIITGGHETLLLVEDDAEVCDIIRSGLEHYGYMVLVATNGREAIHLFEELQGGIDLLITDVIMPVMGGQSLVEQIRQRTRDLPVLYISGHPLDTDVSNLTQKRCDAFIQKPFNPQDLAGMVRRMLGSGDDGA